MVHSSERIQQIPRDTHDEKRPSSLQHPAHRYRPIINTQTTDTGYAWFVLASVFISTSLSIGLISTYGVFIVHWQANFDVSVQTIGWILSSRTLAQFCSSPFAGYLGDRYGCRFASMVGGIILCVGITLMFFTHQLWHVFVCISIAGIGTGLTYINSHVIINYYFKKRLAVANGIVMAGARTGMFVLAPSLRFLIDTYSWRGAMLILGAIIANVIVAGATYRPTHMENIEIMKHKGPSMSSTSYSLHKSVDNFNTLDKQNKYADIYCCRSKHTQMAETLRNLSNVRFLQTCFAVFLQGYACFPVIDYTIKRALDAGIPETHASLLLSLIGLSSMVTSLAHGFLIDRKIISCWRLYTLGLVTEGIACILNPFAHTYTAFVVFAIVFGMAYGVLMALLFVVTRDIVDAHTLKGSYSVVCMSFQLGAIIGSPLNGFLYDVTASFAASLYVCGGALLLSALIIATVPVCFRRSKGNIQDADQNV